MSDSNQTNPINFQSYWQRFKLRQVLKSHICKLVFLASAAAAYFLIPERALNGDYGLLVITFVVTFAASITCTVRNIKDKFSSGIQAGSSLISIVASLIGLTAVQFCSMNAVMCGSTIGFSLIATILPHSAFHFFHFNAVPLLVISIVVQLISLWQIGCLKFENCDD